MLNDTLKYIVMILLASAVIILLFTKRCNHEVVKIDRPVKDTVWVDTVIVLPIEIPKPYPVKVIHFDTVKVDSIVYIDTTKIVANSYNDSLSVEYGTIHWRAITEGRLLDMNARFNGVVPKEVVRYRDKEVPVSGLFMTTSLGYNGHNLGADIGIEYLMKNGRKYGYEYDYINKYHKVTAGFKLF